MLQPLSALQPPSQPPRRTIVSQYNKLAGGLAILRKGLDPREALYRLQAGQTRKELTLNRTLAWLITP
jgi:hypothetical protein